MQIRWLTAFLDFPARQFGSEVTFWRAIAGSTVSPPRGEHREFATLQPFNGDAHLRVQRIESGVGGVHVDIHTDDVRAAADEAVALGAVLAADNASFLVMESPAGLRFCLVPAAATARRSRPIRWPEDTISIIDQVCIDVPAILFDREVSFWSELTGRPTLSARRSEFVRLQRDPRLALGILLQRLLFDGSAPAAAGLRATAHLDLATTSVDDEIARHEDWGATMVERFDSWAVMMDPAGRRYCITDRNPRTGD
ncbi:VOC family protein [Gordonia sp. VNK1]|uniref:VOC family protein n=1 Tax=Gordonia oleivorans TaxID=3156618 RepID=UPI0032B546A4